MSQQDKGGAPSKNIGWRFVNPILGTSHVEICKFGDRRVIDE